MNVKCECFTCDAKGEYTDEDAAAKDGWQVFGWVWLCKDCAQDDPQ